MYSAYDSQCDTYFYTGRNSKTKTECEQDILSFLLENDGDTTEKELNAILTDSKRRKNYLSIFEVSVDKHNKKMSEL